MSPLDGTRIHRATSTRHGRPRTPIWVGFVSRAVALDTNLISVYGATWHSLLCLRATDDDLCAGMSWWKDTDGSCVARANFERQFVAGLVDATTSGVLAQVVKETCTLSFEEEEELFRHLWGDCHLVGQASSGSACLQAGPRRYSSLSPEKFKN